MGSWYCGHVPPIHSQSASVHGSPTVYPRSPLWQPSSVAALRFTPAVAVAVAVHVAQWRHLVGVSTWGFSRAVGPQTRLTGLALPTSSAISCWSVPPVADAQRHSYTLATPELRRNGRCDSGKMALPPLRSCAETAAATPAKWRNVGRQLALPTSFLSGLELLMEDTALIPPGSLPAIAPHSS